MELKTAKKIAKSGQNINKALPAMNWLNERTWGPCSMSASQVQVEESLKFWVL